MSDSFIRNPIGSPFPSEGVTASERYLSKLCKRSFLSLWSYPGVFRDQGRRNGKGDGKEVADLLVVFENHIIIFSDKYCHFPNSGDLEADWSRWYKKAVLKSAEQVWGSERWIKGFSKRLFLDKACTIQFPISLPKPENAIFHRVVVAHDASRRCQEVLGGSGSLMLDTSLIGDAHLSRPFTIGQIAPSKGYVHVFDDTTLDIVITTLDTISDFTAYLAKKERFLTGNRTVVAAGEEELLAVYLSTLNASDEHDFLIKGDYDALHFAEGFWEEFLSSPERQAQIESNRISYAWDKIIEKFTFHAMTGTQYLTSGEPLKEQEIMFRFMAREPRTYRRLLAMSLHEVFERSTRSHSYWDARVMQPRKGGEPLYVLLFVKRRQEDSDDDYRRLRAQLLSDYCHVAKLKFPKATHIIGIASESGRTLRRSEDLLYLDASDWGADAQANAREIQQRLGLLRKTRVEMGSEYEYPVDRFGRPRNMARSRNSPCPCGSGKRFKRCHGKGLFSKQHRSH